MIKWLKINWSISIPILVSVISFILTSINWKRQKKLEDNLARSKSAYDILLKKEFDFYEQSDSIYAQLIVNIQDISSAFQNNYDIDFDIKKRKCIIKDNMLIYVENIKLLKNYLLSYDVYLPTEISNACSDSIVLMQENLDFFYNESKKLWKNKECEIEKVKINEYCEKILYSYTVARFRIKTRLEKLAQI